MMAAAALMVMTTVVLSLSMVMMAAMMMLPFMVVIAGGLGILLQLSFGQCLGGLICIPLNAGIDLIDRHKSEAIRTIHFIDGTVAVIIFRNDCG